MSNVRRHTMLVAVLGSHFAAALVGVGISVVIFACAKVALRMNARAVSASPAVAFAWHSSRLLFGLICAAPIALAWLYLTLELRAPVTVLVCLVAGLVATSYLFVKFEVFGRVTSAGAHIGHAA
jgi:hypothetical protein